MLTRDLLRYRLQGDAIRPIFLTLTGGRKYLELATAVVDTCRAGVGEPIGRVEARLAALPVAPSDLPVWRGFVSLVLRLVTLEAPAVDVEALRRAVFLRAAAHGPCLRVSDPTMREAMRDDLALIGQAFGLAPEDVLPALFSDRQVCRRLAAVDSTLTPAVLIARYNTALAQGMLRLAIGVDIELVDAYQPVFWAIKRGGLMHTVAPLPIGYRLRVDGPLAVLSGGERYGTALAQLLPALLASRSWRLDALLRVGDTDKRMTLTPRDGLRACTPAEPNFDSTLESAFFQRFTRARHPWTIAREGAILDLGDTVLIPDFTFTHRDGRVVHLEIAGYWTPEYLARKFGKVQRLGMRNLVVALPASRTQVPPLPGPVIRYKTRLLLNELLPALEVASRPDSA
jgi:predicted nuclease of restriction endonuclease-like RecB superfamily